MRCVLLDGIYKNAYINPSNVRQFAPWGGTTADTGYRINRPMGVTLAGWAGMPLALKKALGVSYKAGTRLAAPLVGGLEGLYGVTIGKGKAEAAGRDFGRLLGARNRFLGARL